MIVTRATGVDILKVITTEEASKWANNAGSPNDTRVPIYILAAVEHAEAALNRAIFTQSRRTITAILPPHGLQLEPYTSLVVKSVDNEDGTELVVTDRFNQIPESGLVTTKQSAFDSWNAYGYGYYYGDGYGDGKRYLFDYECGWGEDELPPSVREMILGYVSHIARFHGQVSTNDQYLKVVPPLCRPYAIPIGQRPNWILA